MERWEKPMHRRRNNPSFSSSLLDVIYRSIDEPDGGAKERKHTGGAPDPFLSPPSASLSKKKQSSGAFASKAPAAPAEKQSLRRKHEHSDRYHNHNRCFFTSTSSSSGGSSFGGFSSSDAESSRSRNSAPLRSDLPPSPPPQRSSSHRQEKKAGSIRGRFRDLRKPRAGSAPSSPGARLASFLNGLFSGAGSPKEAKNAQRATSRTEEYSACSSASSYTRSCLSKTPSTGGRSKRSVRFGPVSVGGAERSFYKEEREYAAARATEGRRMVEELLRGLEAASDDDDDGGAESDASSDLFELENLAVDVRGGYRDELPVYETTHLATNRAIAQGLM